MAIAAEEQSSKTKMWLLHLNFPCGRSFCGTQGQQLALKCLEWNVLIKKKIIFKFTFLEFLFTMVDPVKCWIILLPIKKDAQHIVG